MVALKEKVASDEKFGTCQKLGFSSPAKKLQTNDSISSLTKCNWRCVMPIIVIYITSFIV